jgi:TonB-linked SusC/RagA family outer membrane protein
MKQLLTSLILLLFMFTGIVNAQDIVVTGTVTDEMDGTTIPGANVQIKGTTIGTVTDFDGKYSITAPSNSTLIFSFLGMKTQEIEIGGRKIINVVLQTDAVDIDEIVVIGYGVQRKSTYTGAASNVKAEKIEQIPVTSFDKALQGSVPGMQVTSASGQPGSNTQVTIRGIGSISAGTQPLYVVDGVPILTGDLSVQGNSNAYSSEVSTQHNALSNLNPNDIESITVLKDASATAIYGSRASNGVILITTKKGKEGKTNFAFRSQFGLSTRTTEHFEVLNAEEYKMLTNEGRINAGLAEQDFSEYEGIDQDWLGEAFKRNAKTSSYEFSANGGTSKTKFYTSASYYNQEGIAISSYLERLSFRTNIDHQATDLVSFGVNLGLSNTMQGTPMTDAAYFTSPVTGGFLLPPIYPVKKEDGSWNMDYPALNGVNFVANNKINDHDSETKRLIGSGYIQLDFTENLVFKSNVGIDWFDMLEEYYDDPRAKGNTAEGKGRATASMVKQLVYSVANTLNWDRSFGNHNVGLLVGHEAQGSNYKDFMAASEDFASHLLRRLSSGATPVTAAGTGTEWRLISLFTQGQYNFNNKYYASFSFRRDGSSRFGLNNRFANFYSIGGSWRISQEPFIKDNFSWMSLLHLRASYGTSGNSQIGNFSSLGLYGYGRDYNGKPGSSPAQFANPDLTWEKNTNWNVGLDFRLFEKFRGTVELYNRLTSDLLLNVPLSSTAGITSMLRNVGEMQNRGVEINLGADLFDPGTSEFLWGIDFNIAFNRNKVLKLADGQDITGFYFLRREGLSFQTFYMERWAGVNPADGRPMWYDKNGNIVFRRADADRVIVGSADPDFTGGFTSNMSYKGFTLNVFFSFVYGNKLYDDTYRILNSDGAFSGFNQSVDQLNRWTTPGQITDTPIRVNGNASESNERSTRNLYDGSYLRLKNVQLGYNLPKKWINTVGLGNVRVYLQGQNLLTWTNYPGMDPEQGPDGTVWFVYPNARTITMGLDVNF